MFEHVEVHNVTGDLVKTVSITNFIELRYEISISFWTLVVLPEKNLYTTRQLWSFKDIRETEFSLNLLRIHNSLTVMVHIPQGCVYNNFRSFIHNKLERAR